MNSLKKALLFLIASLAFVACTNDVPAAPESAIGGSSSAVSGLTWQDLEGGYNNACADECRRGCDCLQNVCSDSVEGTPCSSQNATCNVVNGVFYEVLVCAPAPQSSPPRWTRTSTDSCLDACGSSNCNCITERCSGNPEFQVCGTPGARCYAISGSNYAELTCE